MNAILHNSMAQINFPFVGTFASFVQYTRTVNQGRLQVNSVTWAHHTFHIQSISNTIHATVRGLRY